jgi:hypothetical protein
MSREIMQQAYTTLSHARNFIVSKERMHPTGVDLYDKLVYEICDELAKSEQESVTWGTLNKLAQTIVEEKYLFKRFIDGTPLANDIAVWMTEFALEYTTPPRKPEQEPVCDKDPRLCGFVQCQLGKVCKNTPINIMPNKIFAPNLEQILNAAGFYRREWVGLTDDEVYEIANFCKDQSFSFYAKEIENKLRIKNAV